MAKAAWFGNPPVNETEARERLMDAALLCLQQFGLEKTHLSDIASAAGVTRPTVYSYFRNRDQVLHDAMVRAGWSLTEKVCQHARSFDHPADQVVESVLFCLREFPEHAQLGLNLGPESESLAFRAVLSKEGLEVCKRSLEPVLELCPELRDQAQEMAEVSARILLSLLTVAGPKKRTEAEIRSWLHRRLVPAMGVPAKDSQWKPQS